jgi:hypothetical protein
LNPGSIKPDYAASERKSPRLCRLLLSLVWAQRKDGVNEGT